MEELHPKIWLFIKRDKHALCIRSRSVCMWNMGEESARKMSTDFSIERILSDEPKSVVDAPSWLCCTRYRPPRLPRVTNANCRSRRAGRHARVPFTAAQASALEAAYARAPYLAPPALKALAAALQLRDDRIKIWFQNRRARERREKCTNITPPEDVTLPATDHFHPQIPYLIRERQFVENARILDETPAFMVNATGFSQNDNLHYLSSMQSINFDSSDDRNRSESPLNVDTIDEE